MKYKLEIILGIFFSVIAGLVLAHAQTIDCTQQQNTVNNDLQRIQNQNSDLQMDEANLNACQDAQTVVATPEYATAVKTIQAEQVQPIQANPGNTMDTQGTVTMDTQGTITQ